MKKLLVIALVVVGITGASLYARGGRDRANGCGYGYGNNYKSGRNDYCGGYGRDYDAKYGKMKADSYGMGMRMGKGYGVDLNRLTETQRQSVMNLEREYRQKMFSTVSDIRSENDKIRLELMKDKPDTKLIDNALTKINKLQGDIDRMKIDQILKVRDLTAEPLVK